MSDQKTLGNGVLFALAFWIMTWSVLARTRNYIPRRKKNKIYTIMIALSIMIIAANRPSPLKA